MTPLTDPPAAAREPNAPSRASLLDLLLIVAAAALLSVLTLPGVFAILFGLLGYIVARHTIGRAPFVLICGSMALCLLCFEAGLRLTKRNPAYYRPDEVLARFATGGGRSSYEPNRRIDFAMPYGDLVALSSRGAPEIAEPRQVVFVTDGLGYRNSRGPQGQRFVLIGDSFAMGSGTTQDRILGEALRRDYGVDVYTAAFPGDPVDYAATLDWLRRHTALIRGRNVIALLFEGNDFACQDDRAANSTILDWRWKPATRMETYRLLFGLTRGALGLGERRDAVIVQRIDKRMVAFFRPHREVTWRQNACDWSEITAALKRMSPNLALIALAPTKDRVYADWIGPAVAPPRVQWEYVRATAESLGVPAVDLTPALVRRAAALLPAGRYVFWRDDTHWNADGMDAAAAAIADELAR